MMPEPEPLLAQFRASVSRHFGERLERVILFGSRARGDARPDSDYDIAIFVRDLGNRLDEFRPLARVTLDLLDKHDIDINALLYPAGAWRDPASPLMEQIRSHGLDL